MGYKDDPGYYEYMAAQDDKARYEAEQSAAAEAEAEAHAREQEAMTQPDKAREAARVEMSRRDIERLERLAKRRDFLRERINLPGNDKRDLSYDRAEASALTWAIEKIEALEAATRTQAGRLCARCGPITHTPEGG